VTVNALNGQTRRRGLWGHDLVDAPMFCSTTRVRVRHTWMLVRAWWDFRKVSKLARATPGLKRTAFLIESPTTFIILSLWDGEEGMLAFATYVDRHHVAVRRCFGNAASTEEHPEIWSAQWKIWSASNNLQWNGAADFQNLLPRSPTEVGLGAGASVP
jgi:hypothetical protein